MGNSSSMSTMNIYTQIKSYHDQAYRTIEQAIKLEEQERPNDAVQMYKEGILLIDRCLDISITFPENPDQDWDNACKMIQKMKKTRGEVLTRINCIQTSPQFVHDIPPPPSYEEAIATQVPPRTYNELAVALNNIESANYDRNAEILYTHDNVQMYYISPDGNVLSSSAPQTLNIFLVEGDEGVKPRAFLQIGDFIYPLVAGVSPCYRTDYGAFILPDVHNDKPEYSIGLILPSDADADVYELLENILHGIVNQSPITLEQRKTRSLSGTISNGLVNGAQLISSGLIKGARKTGDLINYGTPKIINNISPNAQATSLPPNLKKSLKFAQKASSTTANVTGFVAEKVGLATSRLGQYLAPHIKKQGTRLLTSGFRLSEADATNKVDNVFTVAAGAVEGFSTVYRGLETSASILGQNLKNNTVKVIEHKYGNPAGEAANDTMDTVGNVWHISNNARILTPKGLAKHTVKQTGRALISDGNNAEGFNEVAEPSTSGTCKESDVAKEDFSKKN